MWPPFPLFLTQDEALRRQRSFPGLLSPGLGGEEAPEGRGRPRERPAAAPPGFEALSAPRGSASGSFLVLFSPFFVPGLTAGGVPPTPCASHGDFAVLQRRCFRECGEHGGCSVPWGFGCVLGNASWSLCAWGSQPGN